MNRKQKMIASSAGLVVLAAAIAMSFLLIGGNAPSSPAQAATAVATATPAADTTVGQPEVILSADFAVAYTSILQLRRAADVVVRGEVTDVSYLDFNTATYTKVTLKVAKCYKGNVAAGDQITIMEVGGVTTMAAIKGDKFGPTTKEDANTKVKVLLEGAPLTQVGDKGLYFLAVGDIGVVPGTYYDPIGAFQGHFKIDSGMAKRFVPTDSLGSKYTSLPMDETAIDDTVAQAAVQ